jgi:asparagine synthase (glutamine-hydrolysing)
VSGLVALHYPDGKPVEPSILEKMTAALAHRGGDGSGLWYDGPVGLGHRLLHTSPESLHETLPLYDPVRRLAITADARLDNREELIAALDVADRAAPDSALILLAYDRWGDACPEKLLGDFAFVIWDGRRRVLFCARDHIGVKPIYYHYSPRRLFTGATEIKALLCHTAVPRRLNERRLGECLALLLDDRQITLYHDILRLPAGHRLTVGPTGIRMERYWDLDANRSVIGRSNDDYAQEFRWLFNEAVRARMRSAFPIGSMLSGGMDSSSVTCAARSLGPAQGTGLLQTFSLVFDKVPSCDERQYIHAVVAEGGVIPHFIGGDRIGPLSDFEQELPYEDEPSMAPNLCHFRAMYDTASANDVRIVLDGIDGDTAVFHGEGYLTELIRAGRVLAVLRELQGIARNGRVPWRRAGRNYVIGPMIPDWLRRLYRSLPGRRTPRNYEAVTRSLVRPDFAKRIHLDERIREAEIQSSARARTVREAHWRRLSHGRLQFILEVIDRAALRRGVEPHHPFLDKRLLEFCLALPPDQKMSAGWTRIVLRRAMEGILPETVRWRPGKSDLSPNFTHGLLTRDRDRLDNGVRASGRALAEYIDNRALDELHNRATIRSDASDTMALWNTVTIGLWLSQK